MTLFRTAGPDVEPVTLADAKAALRIDHSSEDDLISSLIRAAREEVEATTGLAMIDQDWRLVLDGIPPNRLVLLRRGPIGREPLAIRLNRKIFALRSDEARLVEVEAD